ncbi:Pentatricopeptide repeat [Quillaja saponaria]|uniref:Pentatricopeptide repeat n=1 Tax=Quillaja saponaria TaxID=32244 RepID=A0AAD7L085_QUISA|nr:Pentatricopeptide repeat [Quillaja saponaria]
MAFPAASLHSSSSSSSSSSASDRDSATMNRLNHKDWLTPNEVLNIINALKEPSSVITVLDRYAKRKDYKPNEAFYTLVINKLAQAHMFDAIENLMQIIRIERNCRLSDEFFYNVIKVYGNMAGRINRAIETLYDMPKYNCWPSVKTFNFVLNLLVSAKLFDVVHEVYMYAPKLAGLRKQGRVEEAKELLERMKFKGCYPNAASYQESISPSFVSFKLLIHGLCKMNLLSDVDWALKQMVQQGFVPKMGMWKMILQNLFSGNKNSSCISYENLL